MKLKVFLVLVWWIFAVNSEHLTFTCHYKNTNENYICLIKNVVYENESQIVKIESNHRPGKTDSDVSEVVFSDSQLFMIPQEIFEHFDKLNGLDVGNTNLQEFQPLENCKYLVYLLIHNNSLEVLPENAFNECSRLIYLDIQGNKLTWLSDDQFKNLKSLEVLDMRNNQVKILKKVTFDPLENLTELLLDNNPIEVLETDCFSNIKLMTLLSMTHTKLKSLYPDFIEMNWDLNHLIITSDGSLELHHSFIQELRKQENLRNLVLSNVQIASLDEEIFKKMTNLNYLDLSNNLLENIFPEWFKSLQLQHFSVRGNKIKSIDTALFSNMETLFVDLSDNQIEEFGFNIFVGAEKLIQLELNGNKFQEIKSFFFKNLNLLEILNLKDNLIEYMEDNAFEDLVSLRILYLSGNKLQKIDDPHFSNTVNLIKLDLMDNKIVAVESFAFQKVLGSLKSLNLLKNLCIDQSYSSNFDDLREDLTECFWNSLSDKLSCDYEMIEADYACVFRKQRFNISLNNEIKGEHVLGKSDEDVKKIQFEESMLEAIPPSVLKKFTNTRKVSVADTRLKALKNMENCQSLEIFNANQNLITKLEAKTFEKCTNLKEIHLRDNKIYEIDGKMFEALENLKYIDLRSNNCTNGEFHIKDNDYSLVLEGIKNCLGNSGMKLFLSFDVKMTVLFVFSVNLMLYK